MEDEVSLDDSLNGIDSESSDEDVDELGEGEGGEITAKALTDVPNEETRFLAQSWEERWKEVMELLATGKARWDESGDPHTDLLEDYKKEVLKGRDEREKTTPTILHMLAKNLKANDFKNVPDNILKKVILYLLQPRENTSLTTETKLSEEDPILKVAMNFDNDKFIDYILALAPGKLPDLLDARDAAQSNCLHYAFKVQLHKVIHKVPRTRQKMQVVQPKRPSLTNTLKILAQFVKNAKAKTIAAIDKEGNTPVHYALDYELCSMKSKAENYGRIVKHLILRSDQLRKQMPANEFNLKNESPYLYFLRTKKEWIGENKKPPREEKSIIKLPKKDTTSGAKETKEIKEPEAIREINNDAETDPPQPLEKGAKMPGAIAPTEYQGVSEVQPTGSILQPQRREKPTTAPGTKKLNQSYPGSRVIPPTAAEPTPTTAKAYPASLNANNTPPEPLARQKTLTFEHILAEVPSGFATQPILLPKTQIPENEKQSAPSRSNANTKDAGAVAEEIREFLKLHYIRTRSEMEAKELLYGKVASDKNLYFDATNHRLKSVDQVCDLIEKLSASKFEDTLSYVNIPALSHVQDKASTPKQDGGSQQENPCLGHSSLVSVFDKLVSVDVRNILRLHVEDRDPDVPAHTDAAIERAILGQEFFGSGNTRKEAIKVELWDWKKIDLSIDVIRFAAPEVVQVNLYWSGNKTVLTAWACAEGIPLLHRVSQGKLKTVILHATPGIESRERMIKMIENFKKEIKERTEEKVKVEHRLYMEGFPVGSKLDDDGHATAGGSQGAPQHDWVETMVKFRHTLSSLHGLLGDKAPEPQRIKVALIDDGVDLSNLDTYGKVVKASGLSYCPPSKRMEKPWHESTNGHGTIMANMIVRINPWVSLDVMRIHDSKWHHPDGEVRTINAGSAAKAIEGAILRQADIISMSWTIRNLAQKQSASSSNQNDKSGKDEIKSPQEIAINALQTAIDRAREAKILMFCSAADDIKILGKDSLPFSRAPDYIFRIGAALNKGQRDPESEDPKSMTYYFPGNQVAEEWNPRSGKTVQYHNGSSVSTALAAGFASLIMYMNNMMRARYKPIRTEPKEYDTFDEWARGLKDSGNMRRAFNNNNNRRPNTDPKFLPVWSTFGEVAERINNEIDRERKLGELEKLVRSLCHWLDND
ncbi:hypothetical protein AYO21_05377 [Fonsecaea monophora]|uniref:Peptidase S8/S53 domain-containing protein n=1 Tax=Fonsecaea monophora TaxID=254056 RepID=A0A177F8C9_9EURO|nr:hypothetical protein AYO21_05377 [Fonsecaea monophora]OAG40477.1 hypothetical protein AYO21_05377 [Fonsecaea monophora]